MGVWWEREARLRPGGDVRVGNRKMRTKVIPTRWKVWYTCVAFLFIVLEVLGKTHFRLPAIYRFVIMKALYFYLCMLVNGCGRYCKLRERGSEHVR